MLVKRITNLWTLGGPAQVVRFLARRILRIRRHVVYRVDVTGMEEPTWDPEMEVHVVANPEEDITHQAIAANLESRNVEYLQGIYRGEVIGIFVLSDGVPVHWAFVLIHTKTACLLDVDPAAPFVANAFTEPSFRGCGLQKNSLRQRLYECRIRGFSEVYTETHPDNVASRRAMERVGMILIRDVTLLVAVTRIVLRITHAGHKAHRIGIC